MRATHSAVYLCIAFTLLARLQAYPLLKSKSEKEQQSTWFDLFSEDGSIKQDVLEAFPLYEYVYADYEYGDQIWSDCGKKVSQQKLLLFEQRKCRLQLSLSLSCCSRSIFRPCDDRLCLREPQPTSKRRELLSQHQVYTE